MAVCFGRAGPELPCSGRDISRRVVGSGSLASLTDRSGRFSVIAPVGEPAAVSEVAGSAAQIADSLISVGGRLYHHVWIPACGAARGNWRVRGSVR